MSEQLFIFTIFVGTFVCISALLLAINAGLVPGAAAARARIRRVLVGEARGVSESGVRYESVRRRDQDSAIGGLDRMLKRCLPRIGRLRERLRRAGWSITVGAYVLGSILTGFLATGGAVFFFGLPTVAAVLFGIAVGAYLPKFAVDRAIVSRRRRFVDLLGDATDLIVRGAKAGLPVTESVRVVGQEISDPVGAEFRWVDAQMRVGVPFHDALEATGRRVDVPEFNFLIVTLGIQQETGGSLADTLETLSDMIRRRHQLRLKIKAMSSEARASAVIVGSLPFVIGGVLYLVNPDYVMTLFTTPMGLLLFGVGVLSFLCGTAVLMKMIRFDV